eukprot:TRINITY_DN13405_c0_g1_i1.p1 TRINITY_DN13405_c0_g1~~TRINITY_DN13405_c0_g1_i1.p1  ORF type:complete len:1033 (+),score=129.15 TRINITY_DN13405_c0_g1_i1:48-3146(+)
MPRDVLPGYCKKYNLTYCDPLVEQQFIQFLHALPNRRNSYTLIVASCLFILWLWLFKLDTPYGWLMRGTVSALNLATGIVLLTPWSRRVVPPNRVEYCYSAGATFVICTSVEFYLTYCYPELFYSGKDFTKFTTDNQNSMLAGTGMTLLVAYMSCTVRTILLTPILTSCAIAPFLVCRWATRCRDPTNIFICRIIVLIILNAVGSLARGSEERMQRAVFEQQREMQRKEQQARRAVEVVDSLLQSVLPARIVELLRVDLPAPDYYPLATVVYIDIVDFTNWAALHSPAEVVSFLNDVFCAFDHLAATARPATLPQPASDSEVYVEKIKAVGDAYWAVSGLQAGADPTCSALAALHFAFAVQGWVASYRREPILQCRIGLHSGPVIAGIVGKLKCSYDVFGMTDVVAQRLEASSVPGKVHVSEATRKLICSHVVCCFHEGVPVEGVGRVAAFFAEPCPCTLATLCPVPSLPGNASGSFNSIKSLQAPTAFSVEPDRPQGGRTFHTGTIISDESDASDHELCETAPHTGTEPTEPHVLTLPRRWHHLRFLNPIEMEIAPSPAPPEEVSSPNANVLGFFVDKSFRKRFATFQKQICRPTHAILAIITGCFQTCFLVVYLLISPKLVLALRGIAWLLSFLVFVGVGILYLHHRVQPPVWALAPVAIVTVLTVPFGTATGTSLVRDTDISTFFLLFGRLMVVIWIATFHCFHHRHPLTKLGLSVLTGLAGLTFAYHNELQTYVAAVVVQLGLTLPYSVLAHQSIRQQFLNYLEICDLEMKAIADAEICNSLVANLFPESVVPRLLSLAQSSTTDDHGQLVIADTLPCLGVLFGTVDGLEASTILQQPQEAFRILNEIFSALDARVKAEMALEKIKIIGKTYMVVTGIPAVSAEFAGKQASAYASDNGLLCGSTLQEGCADLPALLGLAIHFQDLVRSFSAPDGSISLTARVGIHVGPAMGAVLGRRMKICYDVFGDTVNTAARLASSTAALNGVCVSRSVVDLVRDSSKSSNWSFTGPTTILAKGKGQLEVFRAAQS